MKINIAKITNSKKFKKYIKAEINADIFYAMANNVNDKKLKNKLINTADNILREYIGSCP